MLRKTVIALLAIVALAACNPKDPDDVNGASFDRRAMNAFYADHLIIPSINSTFSSFSELENAILSQQADEASLAQWQQLWKQVYIDWQYANTWGLGPGLAHGTKEAMSRELGIFPVNTGQVESKIASNDTLHNDFSRDTRGLYTMEYLLFQNTSQLLAQPSRQAYLRSVMRHFRSSLQGYRQAWDSHRETFINSTGTHAGSSASGIFNAMVASYEDIKNHKLMTPMGKRPEQSQKEPLLAEARFSGLSILGIKHHFHAITLYWEGKTRNGENGPGFKEYLQATVNGQQLVESTEQAFAAIQAAGDQIDNTESFQALVINNDPRLESWLTEFQRSTRFIKSEMSSILGIAITYIDGDGD